MRKSLRFPQYSLFFILVFGFKTLKAIDKPPLAVPSRDSLERSVANKSIWDIFAEANKHTYTNIDLALAYANIALEKARKLESQKDIFDAQRLIGFIYEDNGMPAKYIPAYEEAARIAEALPDSFKTTIYNDLAIVHRKNGNYRLAFSYYEKVLSIAERIND